MQALVSPEEFPTAVVALREISQRYGDQDAYVESGDRRLSFAAWDRAAAGLATAFAGLGVVPGDVIALVLPSSSAYAVCYQAAMRLGAITTGINPRLGVEEIRSILARTAPKVLVSDDDGVPDAALPTVLVRSQLAPLYELDPQHRADPDPDGAVAVVWTSGTTGAPKGAVFGHPNLIAVSRGAGSLTAPFDRRMSATPFSHVAYMTHVWEEISYVITTVMTPTPWKAEDAIRLLAEERVTVGQGVPAYWRLILDHPSFASRDLSKLRIAGSGASPVPPELVREMKERLGCPVVIGYASTEAAIITGSAPSDSPDVIARTVGRPRSNVEVQIAGASGPAPVGEVGTVCCRSAAMMRGYWNDPEATASAIDGDGWLSTGDLGYLDVQGYLTLAGRLKEMYLRGGYNVYPVEVERILSMHEGVRSAAVVAKADPVLGEIGVAFVVAAAGITPSRQELREWCKRSVADYKAPDLVVVVDELPLTAVGKVDKRALADRARTLRGPERL